MIQRNGSVTDEYSRPVPGATVYVYNQDGTDATLTLDGTTPITEPITTDEWGGYSYFADDGLYREDIWFGGKRRAVDYNVAVGDPGLVFKGDPGSPGEGYATRAAMQAAATAPTDGDDFYETETGGKWVYRAGNYSSLVTADTRGGLYRQAGAIATSAGALVRQFSGPVLPSWFRNSGDSDDQASAQAALTSISNSASLHRWLHFSAGTYLVTGLTITAATGLKITGEGRTKTIIRATSTSPALAINGLWYSTISGISFQTALGLSGKGVVEQDGNYDGTHTQGTQAITWEQCDFNGLGTTDGLMSDYAFTMNRQGQSSAQGSENLFLNCHFYSGTLACYYQHGFNGLNNTFIGGNFQHYPKNGLQCDTGSVQVLSVGFQSTYGYTQVLNGGYDINMAGGGVNEGVCIYGCRTESLRFFNGATSGAQRFDIRGINQSSFSSNWQASHAYALNDVNYETTASGLTNLYVITTAGTSGASKPTFPDTGTVADGTAVWTQTPVTVVTMGSVGEYSDRTSFVWFSNSVVGKRTRWRTQRDIAGPATITLKHSDEGALVNASAGSVALTLPTASTQPPGQAMLIQRYDSSTNTVTISGASDYLNGTLGTLRLPPGGCARFEAIGSGTVNVNSWRYVGGDAVWTTGDTATAASGAVTVSDKRNRVTSEALTTAAGSSYTLTITNPRIKAQSILAVNLSRGTSTNGKVAPGEILCADGSATVEVRNVHASAALNGTVLVNYAIL